MEQPTNSVAQSLADRFTTMLRLLSLILLRRVMLRAPRKS